MKFNFEATGWALDQLPALRTASEKLVLLILAARHNDFEKCARPGIDRIASDLGIEPRSVKRALKNLAKIGILSVQMRDKLKLPSLYFLNFDYHFDGVGDTVAPKSEKMPVKVAKSRCEGDKKSPTRVTESHPNKQEDNKLLKKQHVVVLENLVWEKPLTTAEKSACEKLLAGSNLQVEIQQRFADEMSGSARKAPIRNPGAWLSVMLKKYVEPDFKFGYADQVAATRVDRVEQARRESMTMPPPPAMPVPVKTLSSIGRQALEDSRRLMQQMRA